MIDATTLRKAQSMSENIKSIFYNTSTKMLTIKVKTVVGKSLTKMYSLDELASKKNRIKAFAIVCYDAKTDEKTEAVKTIIEHLKGPVQPRNPSRTYKKK